MSRQAFSLQKNPHLIEYPVSKWLKMATNSEEFLETAKTLSGIPVGWIQWVEKRTQKNIQRGIRIERPLDYRINFLWHGIISLQETKFICDMLENAFRHVAFSYTSQQGIQKGDILNTIPNLKNLSSLYRREARRKLESESLIEPSFFSLLTFYQMTEIFYRNWRYFSESRNEKNGFVGIFYSSIECRDKNLFSSEMKTVRDVRNEIAHSKRLFLESETQKVYRIALRWLKPIDVQLKNRILYYRSQRPRFLEKLDLY